MFYIENGYLAVMLGKAMLEKAWGSETEAWVLMVALSLC